MKLLGWMVAAMWILMVSFFVATTRLETVPAFFDYLALPVTLPGYLVTAPVSWLTGWDCSTWWGGHVPVCEWLATLLLLFLATIAVLRHMARRGGIA